MDWRSKALYWRIAQFVVLAGTVVAGTFLLVDGAGEAALFGVSNRAIFGMTGIILLAVVSFAGSNIIFKNLPASNPAGTQEPDARKFSYGATGKYAELSYSALPSRKETADDLGKAFGLKSDFEK